MLQYCTEFFCGLEALQMLTKLDIFSVGSVLEYTQENTTRALENLRELGSASWRTLAYCVFLYAVFVAIVMKIFAPKKHALALKVK